MDYRRQQRKLATTVGSVSPPNDRRSFASGSPSQKGGISDPSAVHAKVDEELTKFEQKIQRSKERNFSHLQQRS